MNKSFKHLSPSWFWEFFTKKRNISKLHEKLEALSTAMDNQKKAWWYSCAQWWANIIKWTRTNIRIYSDATLCTERISKYIRISHIYRTNIQIYSYVGISTNTNTKNIQWLFYLNIWIFILITDWRHFWKGLTHASFKKRLYWIFFYA